MQKKHTIVLAEDAPFISQAYTAALEKVGYVVVAATDGVEALAFIQQYKPDVILLDIIMPLKTGFEVLEEIKQQEGLKNIPVIMFSNLGQKEDIEKARNLGAIDYVNKDVITMKEVIEKVDALFE